MKTYQIRLRPHGSWCTPWDADSLFGALAWQVRELAGEDDLGRFLHQFTGEPPRFVGEAPPFVLSDAFPEGWLPCPLSAELKRLPELKAKFPEWVCEEQFKGVIRGSAQLLPREKWPAPLARGRNLHASINRVSGTTTGEGSSTLFEIPEWCFKEADGKRPELLVVYVKTDAWLDRLASLFESLAHTGFGKKRSSGRGGFAVEGKPQACEWIDKTYEDETADGFVSLSHFVPALGDPTHGRWSVVTKYPKFSPGAPAGTPFKGRLAMLRPGSTFHVQERVSPFYGRMLKGLSDRFPNSVQYGLSFAVPIRWPPVLTHGEQPIET